MTEYVSTEVGHHQWFVFADRQSIAFCADEDEAVKAMTEHSARSRRSRGSADNSSEQSPPARTSGLEFTRLLDFPRTFCPGC
jgi:hypothetical protein